MKGICRSSVLSTTFVLVCCASLALSCDQQSKPTGVEQVEEDDDPVGMSERELASFKRLKGVPCDSLESEFPPRAGSLGEIHMPYTYGVVREEPRKSEPSHSDQLHQAVGELNGSFHGCLRRFGLKVEKDDCFVFEVRKADSAYQVGIKPSTSLGGWFEGTFADTRIERCVARKLESEGTPNLDKKQPLNVCLGYFNDFPLAGH